MVRAGHVSPRAHQQYDLDKVIHKGRIWRLVYDGVKFDRSDALARDTTVPRMNDETPAQLVTHLGHPNGWWRDTAQQLLVLKQDKSVVPTLQATLKTSTNLLERFHVLWTLEGLGALDAATVRNADGRPRAADAHPGDSRERDALQGRRQVVRRRLQADGAGPERRRRDSGDADDEQVEGA